MTKQQIEVYNFVTTNIPKFAESLDTVKAIGLSGSYALGNEDSLSDIDICVYVFGDLPTPTRRQQVYTHLGSQDFIYRDVDFEYSRGDGILVNGIRCDFNWMNISIIECFLLALETDFDCPEYIPGGLAIVKPLHDPNGVIKGLQAAIPPYSDVRAQHRIRKAINEAYYSLYELGWLEKAVARQDYLLFLKHQYNLLDTLGLVLFALNKEWLAQEKTLLKRLANFAEVPKDLAGRMQAIILHQDENRNLQSNLANLKKLYADTVQLIQQRYPELNLPEEWR